MWINTGMKKMLIAIVAVVVAYIALITAVKGPLTKPLGEARVYAPKVASGFDLDTVDGIQGRHVSVETRFDGISGRIIREWSARDFVDWNENAKVTAPRILLAKLMAGVDVDAVNNYLIAAKPSAPSGSSWTLRPKADYDFTEIVLASILLSFGDTPELLWPETSRHIADVLLIEHGYRVRHTVPGTLGLVADTENHILMTEGSRYLRNLWLARHGEEGDRHGPKTARHAAWLASYIDDLEQSGLYEFNSQPYGGYTMAALLILDAHAEDSLLRDATRRLLDRLSYQYALADMQLRRVVPFRRRLERASRSDFTEDPMTAMMISWFGDAYGFGDLKDFANHHHAVISAVMPYRPGPAVVAELGTTDHTRVSFIGRGPKASPEIHAEGPGFVLSAGGVSWGVKSGISARPTTLLLADNAVSRVDCFSILGEGEFTEWNNTGVYLDFACGSGAMNIPDAFDPIAESGGFEVYTSFSDRKLSIIVYRDTGVSILTLMNEWQGTAHDLADRLSSDNRDKNALFTTFRHPSGDVYEYDLNAKAGTWVMKRYNGITLDRDYGDWSRLRFKQ
jgi:hypothetical protein